MLTAGRLGVSGTLLTCAPSLPLPARTSSRCAQSGMGWGAACRNHCSKSNTPGCKALQQLKSLNGSRVYSSPEGGDVLQVENLVVPWRIPGPRGQAPDKSGSMTPSRPAWIERRWRANPRQFSTMSSPGRRWPCSGRIWCRTSASHPPDTLQLLTPPGGRTRDGLESTSPPRLVWPDTWPYSIPTA